MKYLLIICCMLFTLPAAAQQFDDSKWNTLIDWECVIIQSTQNYNAALATAKAASAKLGYELKLLGYKPNKELGLSFSKEDCEGDGYDYPCYIPRGNGSATDGAYVSIEYSNGYEHFAKGYYIVMIASGQPGAAVNKQALAKARPYYKDVYAKRTKAWFGCMH